jgi:hypothetical protein
VGVPGGPARRGSARRRGGGPQPLRGRGAPRRVHELPQLREPRGPASSATSTP